jgi:prostaglandin-H2 D-isomerase / glutathione transferase
MKLVYFNGRGLAEVSRLLLALGGEDYNDFRYPLEIIDWKTHNMVKDEFDTAKKENKLLSSLNKVPFLEVDGTIIPQSKSIERYLARRYNLMGDTDLESARIDSICECIRDFKDLYQRVRKTTEEEREESLRIWFNETLVEKLDLLENIVGLDMDLGDVLYSVGNKLSLADVVIFAFITQFFDDKVSARNAMRNSPKLKTIVDTLDTNSKIMNWIEKRPETSF